MSQPSRRNAFLPLEEKLAWLRLSRTENIGPITFYRLIEAYGSARRALEALPGLARRGGRKKPLKAPEAGIPSANTSLCGGSAAIS